MGRVPKLVAIASAIIGVNNFFKFCTSFAHQPGHASAASVARAASAASAGGRPPGRPPSTSLLKHVRKMLTTMCEVPRNSAVPIIISVSGGQDSVALLCLVHEISKRWCPPWKLYVLHFNHGLRPEASEEEVFVRDLAKTLDVPFFVRHHPDPFSLKGSKSGLQAAARAWRQAESKRLLAALEDSDTAAPKGVILLAHHADDQVETQLLKLLRGAHLARLGGMRFRDGPFARPLLEIRKEELRSFLRSKKQSWMEDDSNRFPVYQRNRVRLQLVPMLVDLFGGKDALHSRFAALGQQSRQLASLLEGLCQQYEGPRFPAPDSVPSSLDISSFPQLPEMVRYEFVWRFVTNCCGAMLSHEAIGGIVDAINSDEKTFTWLLGSGWELTRQGSQLVVSRDKSSDRTCRTWSSSDLLVVQNVSHHLCMELERKQISAFEKVDKGENCSEIILHGVPAGSNVTLRGGLPGDRFQKARLARSVKLTFFLHRELGVPPSARPNWPIITVKAPGSNEVVAAVLPDHVAGNFQFNDTAQRSAEVLPTVIALSWDGAWPGFKKTCLGFCIFPDDC